MLLGVGAMVAAGRSGNSGLGQAGAAAIAGPTQAIQNTMFGYMRAQEDQADRAAVKFLTATGQSAKGMYETFKRLADQTLYQTRGMNPYMQIAPAAERARGGAGRHGAATAPIGTTRIRRRCRRGTT